AQEKFVAANVDQLVIVVAAANPEPRHGFVDRCLAVAFDQGITPILVITKSDLANPEDFLEAYKALEIKSFKSSLPRELRENSKNDLIPPNLLGALQGKKSVLIG
ncbi:MAG: GTPase RsgA, partial [Actinomycetales bacterium]